MVNALIEIDDETNRILNTVKAAKGLRDKSEAVMYVTKQFAHTTYIAFDHDGRQFKPSFVKQVLKASEKGEFVQVNDWDAREKELEALIRAQSRQDAQKIREKSTKARKANQKKN